ncbi:unnamed protein product [Auanema sp. JU1783]|nr:unnamed protein product [Auanema sp. JU1783]
MVNGRREYISISILFVVNLLNYVDRYTVAGVLTDVQKYYNIDDSSAGLIQSVFLAFFIVGSPICGYLGDRFNRKLIILVGVVIWLGAVLGSTFVSSDNFWLFLLFRGLVGIGEASYSNVSPSLISDMFTGPTRSRMYMLFYFAVPVGSGLGFVVGSNVASATGHWQWGVRVTALVGIFVTILLLLFVHEPVRGGADASTGAKETNEVAGSYWDDIKALICIPTFVCCTWGYTALVFVTGTLTWWEPTIIEYLMAYKNQVTDVGEEDHDHFDKDKDSIGLIFGGITTVAGLIGVSMGTLLAGWIKAGTGPFRIIQTVRAQPIVSGFGALVAAPLLAIVFIFGEKSLLMLWILLFVLITFLSLNWGLNVDMLMTVIVPSRRSTAFSYFMLISHLFGDATGPYLIGIISDQFLKGKPTYVKDGETVHYPHDQYTSLVKASSITVALLAISAILYFITALCLVRDQRKYNEQMGQSDLELKRADSPTSLHQLNPSAPPDDISEKIRL